MINYNSISIVVPIYNGEQYLKQCIDSLINQDYKDIEIILVNDGSTDGSRDICEKYMEMDNRVKLFNLDNGGVSKARNYGISQATGEYITFVDADDWIEPEYCSKMLDFLKKNDLECCICGYNRVYNSNQVERINISNDYVMNSNEFLEKILHVQNGIGFSHMKLIKLEIIKNNNLTFDTSLSVSEDALFCMKLSSVVKRVGAIGIPLYNYRCNTQSVVRKYDENYYIKYLNGMKAAKEYIVNYYGDSDSIKKGYYNYVVYHLLLITINYAFNPDNKLNMKNQIKKMKEICSIPEFNEAIKKSNYEGLSLTRKITLFTLKKHLYCVTKVIGDIRQYQFRKN